jgi:hypothetical protein
MGVLATNPLLLLETKGGPVVVDGHLRMAAAHAAGVTGVPAFLLPEHTASDVVLFQALSGRAGGLSDVEKLIAVRKTALYAQYGFADPDGDTAVTVPDNLISVYSQFLSREVTRAYLEQLLRILDFPSDELALLHVLDTPLDHLTSLLDLSADERRGLLLLRTRIPITASETRKLVRLFLALRGPGSQSRFDFKHWYAAKISSYDSHTRGKDLLAELRSITHPNLTRREDAVETSIQSLRFPPSMRLSPPENLEGDSFSCYFRFSSVEEIEDHVRRIRRAIDEGTIGSLLEHLNEE